MAQLGEILAGPQTYFIEPVAMGNDRTPIIPAQIRPLAIAAAGLGDYYAETSVGDAVKPAAALFGIPIIGYVLVIGGAFAWGMFQGFAENKTKRKRRA